ncbi:D123 domain containing protein [Elaphomyces granulatus]
MQAPQEKLPFPPLTRTHLLHCSGHYWHPLYRSITPKARLIPLTDPFLSYLRADGIFLPPDGSARAPADDDSGIYTFSEDTDSDDEEEYDPSTEWPDIHSQIKATIEELGGKVTPKLNWSAPKDATFMLTTNDLQCRNANDIYLLLKSSDFITHDLDYVFVDCEKEKTDLPTSTTDPPAPQTAESPTAQKIPYYLILRKYFNLNPALEFRCFVRNRTLLCMCQRDLNHFDFLFPMRDLLRARIQSFFDGKLKHTFPDPNFVFDVYIPPPHERVWLIDINPWAMKTDPLIFSWKEVLGMKEPTRTTEDRIEEGVVRLSLNSLDSPESTGQANAEPLSRDDSDPSLPEFRLVARDDPEAYGFTTPQYSAHKLPREVVDAASDGPGGMKEFMGHWQNILEKRVQEEQEEGPSDSKG